MPDMAEARVLVITSAVGLFGTAETGGVSRFSTGTCAALRRLGLAVDLACPEGSVAAGITAALSDLGVAVLEVAGTRQPTAASVAPPATWPAVADSLLARMLAVAFERRGRYSAILNLNHDWLPLYLTRFFPVPLLHVPNLTASDAATDAMVREVAEEEPAKVAFVSRFQAARFGVAVPRVVPPGLDPGDYRLGDGGEGRLAWAGRIAPEKGLHHAAEIAAAAGRTLHVAGGISDPAYWRDILDRHGDRIRHHGFLDQAMLQDFLGRSGALLQTQEWDEALGIVTIESLLCGTPVIAYDRGANAEVLAGGAGGVVIAPDAAPDRALAAIDAALALDRLACRESAIARYSAAAMTEAYRDWLGACGIAV
jgi:UDP-glucose:tetrahydrobiopterin glucosyltransferase